MLNVNVKMTDESIGKRYYTSRYKRYYKINIQQRGSAEICLRNALRERKREGTTSLVFRTRFAPSTTVLSSTRILQSKIQVLNTFSVTCDKARGRLVLMQNLPTQNWFPVKFLQIYYLKIIISPQNNFRFK